MINELKALALSVLLLLPTPAWASVVTFNFDTVYSGYLPGDDAPWGNISFEDVSGGVLLTIAATNLGQSDFISDVYFNFNPNKSLSGMVMKYVSGVKPASYEIKKNSEKAGPLHNFDIDIAYSTWKWWNRFDDDSVTKLLISGISGLQASDFDYSIERRGNSYYAAAHLQAICGNYSAWIAADPPIAVAPEPASMFLMGIGLVSTVVMGRRTRHRNL